jgi:hypothetical protein
MTLASALGRSLGLEVAAPRKLTTASELALSGWMAEHLSVEVFPFADPDQVGWIEDRVLDVLDPPLNLDRRPATPTRTRLTGLRRALVQGEPLMY